MEGKYQHSNRDYYSNQPTADFISTLPQRKGMKKGDGAGKVESEEEEKEATEDQSRETE